MFANTTVYTTILFRRLQSMLLAPCPSAHRAMLLAPCPFINDEVSPTLLHHAPSKEIMCWWAPASHKALMWAQKVLHALQLCVQSVPCLLAKQLCLGLQSRQGQPQTAQV